MILIEKDKISIYFGYLIKKSYSRLYSQGSVHHKTYEFELPKYTFFEFVSWLYNKFPNEVIRRGHSYYQKGNLVLIVNYNETLCDEYYFCPKGLLAKQYLEGKLYLLINEFIEEVSSIL